MTEIDRSYYELWGTSIACAALEYSTLSYLEKMPVSCPSINWIWAEMDAVWDSLGLDNTMPLCGQPIAEFYSHPVWLMNGVFTAIDPVSVQHRMLISKYIYSRFPHRVADFGGGFGELALLVASLLPEVSVDIIEPYPSNVAKERARDFVKIKFVDGHQGEYDLIVAQDVLEHVDDPVGLACRISESVREGGCVIFANCFFPVIKCHLPATFHLRFTFPWMMQCMGLRYIGVVDGAEHAQIYQRKGSLNIARVRMFERISIVVGPLLNFMVSYLSRIKRYVLAK